MPIAAAPPPAQVATDSRSAMVCVRADGPRPLFFTGKLIAKRPGAKPPGDFELPLKVGSEQCNHLLRSKVADWKLSVTTPGFTACPLSAPEFGYRITYLAKAGARGVACPQVARAPIGTWK
jgi:hypothetical protein